MHVSLHIKPKASKGRHENPAGIILAYYSDVGGSYTRMFVTRGINPRSLGSRECKEDEYKECAHKHRQSYLVYNDWDALIRDEKKFDVADEWIQKLEELKNEYPQFVKA